jgi:transcriptional regulator with XRE-family HTH domain
MSIADFDPTQSLMAPVVSPADHDENQETETDRPLHRISEVRAQQGVTLRAAARQMGTTVRQARLQEDGEADLHLSTLYAWQKALDVPVANLLVDLDAPLSMPVMRRAQLLRMMKTAMSLLEKAPGSEYCRMAQRMVDGLIEIMPELECVTPWHEAGQRRRLDDLGRAAERQFSSDLMGDHEPWEGEP